MKMRIGFLIGGLSLLVNCLPDALAGNVSYTSANADTQARLNGEADVKHIGSMAVAGGHARINGDAIDVVFSKSDPSKKTLSKTEAVTSAADSGEAEIQGVVVDTQQTGDDHNRTISGLVFFTSGSGLNDIDNPKMQEVITLKDGTVYKGHIKHCTSADCTVISKRGEQDVRTRDIASIKSPRAYRMSLELVGAGSKARLPEEASTATVPATTEKADTATATGTKVETAGVASEGAVGEVTFTQTCDAPVTRERASAFKNLARFGAAGSSILSPMFMPGFGHGGMGAMRP